MKSLTTTLICLLLLAHVASGQQADSEIDKIAEVRKTSCDSALIVAQEMDKSKYAGAQLAKLELEMGMTHYCLGNYDLALFQYQAAIDLFTMEDDFLQVGTILNLIGTLQKKQGDMETALDYFNQGLEIGRDKNDSLGIGNSLNNIGLVYLQTERPNEALAYFLESTDVKSAVGDTIGLSYNYDNLGQTYSKLGDFEKAENYLNLAGEYKLLIGDKVGFAIVRNNVGEMFMQNSQPNEAESYFLEALEVATEVNYADFKQYVLGQLSAVKESQSNFSEALTYFKRQQAIQDSLFNERKAQQVAELETKYQTEKKEREIESKTQQIERNNILLASSGGLIILLITIGLQGRSRLKWKNRQLQEEQTRLIREAEINAVISSQEKERNRFARDLHDGFGQLISTLNMNLNSLSKTDDKTERQSVFENSSGVLDEMYKELKNICFDLMPQTLIKHGLEAALNEFASRVNSADQKQIEVNVFGLEERLSDVQEISLYRISQEWTNNVLKYSDAERITIQLTMDEDEITLMIEDDGTGFDKTLLVEGKGNGWKNLNSRTNLIKGTLDLETVENAKGNSLILNAPRNLTLQKVEEIPA